MHYLISQHSFISYSTRWSTGCSGAIWRKHSNSALLTCCVVKLPGSFTTQRVNNADRVTMGFLHHALSQRIKWLPIEQLDTNGKQAVAKRKVIFRSVAGPSENQTFHHITEVCWEITGINSVETWSQNYDDLAHKAARARGPMVDICGCTMWTYMYWTNTCYVAKLIMINCLCTSYSTWLQTSWSIYFPSGPFY